MEQEKIQVAITEESRQLLVGMLRDEMAAAVTEGVRAAMTKEAASMFASAFVDAMRQQATLKVDSWAGGMVRGAARTIWNNGLLFLIAGMIVYSVGGWTAVAKLIGWGIAKVVE